MKSINMLNSTWFIFDSKIDLSEARLVERQIEIENVIGGHMFPIKARELIDCFVRYGWICARYEGSGDLAGCLKLDNLDQLSSVYEWGSLLVMPNARWRKLWHTLVDKITHQFQQRSLVMVTKTPAVIHLWVHSPNQHEILQENMWSRLRWIISWLQKLEEEERIFVNKTMLGRISTWEFND